MIWLLKLFNCAISEVTASLADKAWSSSNYVISSNRMTLILFLILNIEPKKSNNNLSNTSRGNLKCRIRQDRYLNNRSIIFFHNFYLVKSTEIGQNKSRYRILIIKHVSARICCCPIRRNINTQRIFQSVIRKQYGIHHSVCVSNSQWKSFIWHC